MSNIRLENIRVASCLFLWKHVKASGGTFHLSEVLHSDSASTFQYEHAAHVRHGFCCGACRPERRHGPWLSARSRQLCTVHVEVFITIIPHGLSIGDYFITSIWNMLQIHITCLVFTWLVFWFMIYQIIVYIALTVSLIALWCTQTSSFWTQVTQNFAIWKQVLEVFGQLYLKKWLNWLNHLSELLLFCWIARRKGGVCHYSFNFHFFHQSKEGKRWVREVLSKLQLEFILAAFCWPGSGRVSNDSHQKCRFHSSARKQTKQKTPTALLGLSNK